MPTPESNGDYETAQARRVAYGLISYGFQYPERAVVDAVADPQRWSSWPDVLHGFAPEAAAHLAAVRASLAAGVPCRAGITAPGGEPVVEPTELQETFNSLFGHAVRGKCPPYELEYGRSEIIQQASFLADVAGFYAAFGVEMSHGACDRPDHIAAESEFMSILCAKEAYAIEQCAIDHLAISVKAQRDFLRDHLARWLSAFAHRVCKADLHGFYGALARFAAAFGAAECHRFEISSGSQTLGLRHVDPERDASIGCGTTSCGSGGVGDELVELGVHPQQDGAGGST